MVTLFELFPFAQYIVGNTKIKINLFNQTKFQYNPQGKH